MIYYRSIDYKYHGDRDRILAMYQKIFNVDASGEYDFLYKSSHFSSPLGVVAIDDDNGSMVGHFTSVSVRASIAGNDNAFRISMGFMTDPDYRGRGIATNLYHELKKVILNAGENGCFIIGFPNDNSFKMHVDRMEYSQYRPFQFVDLPNEQVTDVSFTKVDSFETDGDVKLSGIVNHVCHDVRFLNSRYESAKYEKYLSDTGNLYICTQFRDKVDILFWSDYLNERELLAFAHLLHQRDGVNRVTTWNSVDYLNNYPREDREYHMCINYLKNDSEQIKNIDRPWVFYMGDCELF